MLRGERPLLAEQLDIATLPRRQYGSLEPTKAFEPLACLRGGLPWWW
jgi:hypothetical protein